MNSNTTFDASYYVRSALEGKPDCYGCPSAINQYKHGLNCGACSDNEGCAINSINIVYMDRATDGSKVILKDHVNRVGAYLGKDYELPKRSFLIHELALAEEIRKRSEKYKCDIHDSSGEVCDLDWMLNNLDIECKAEIESAAIEAISKASKANNNNGASLAATAVADAVSLQDVNKGTKAASTITSSISSYLQHHFELNLEGKTPPSLREFKALPVYRNQVRAVDTQHLIDRQIIDIHWLWCRQQESKFTNRKVSHNKYADLLSGNVFNFDLAYELAIAKSDKGKSNGKFWTTGHKAEGVLNLTPFEMLQMSCLRTKCIRDRWRNAKVNRPGN